MLARMRLPVRLIRCSLISTSETSPASSASECTVFNLSYIAPRCSTLKSSGRRGYGPDRHRHPPVFDICPLPGHMPPQLTPALGQTRDRCTRRLFWGEGAGVQGANVGSRDVNWWAWLMDDSLLHFVNCFNILLLFTH